jgi:hypothetical protein
MHQRQRRNVLQVIVVLGAVVPFVIGAALQFRPPRIGKPAPSTVDSVEGPQERDPERSASFRSLFDVVQIGMTDIQAEDLLGNPSQDDWIDHPTHADTWFSEDGGVSHKTWGPPWKVYWLLTSVRDDSRWWSSDGFQAFVLYDDKRNVIGKMWLENRRDQ